ncbi:MAG: FkbM family methyltransferase [Planctomycetes bacterium]|nr:FkbM family methyltransferase [Planctomycetota bacterium]
MPSIRERIAFLRRAGVGYAWLLLLRRLGKKRARRLHGDRRFLVPLDTAGGIQLMRKGEVWMVPLLRAVLPVTSGSFIDAGASVGQTLLQLRAADEERPWIGFEPSAQPCETIRALVKLNGLRNTRLFESGLSDRHGDAVLHGISSTDGSASMIRDYHGSSHPSQNMTFNVTLTDGATLTDEQLEAPVGVVKIDVEGMELEVIRGLRGVIERDRPLLVCEILPMPDEGTERTRRLLARQQDLMALLCDLRYRLVHIGMVGGYTDVEAPRNDVDRHAGNYLLIPAERYGQIRKLLS